MLPLRIFLSCRCRLDRGIFVPSFLLNGNFILTHYLLFSKHTFTTHGTTSAVLAVPRSCDTSRAGSAGVDGMMNTQSARGEVTNPPARQSCNSNADGYYPVKIFMKYNRTRNHPAFSGQTYEQSRQGRPRTRDARQDARKICCYRHRQALLDPAQGNQPA